MTDLTPSPALTPVVQLEVNTLALGGTGNPMNIQAQALLNRTEFIRDLVTVLSERADYLESFNQDLLELSELTKGVRNLGTGYGNTMGSFIDMLIGFSVITPAKFGILSIEEGATDPVAELAKWESMRVAAESIGAQVYVPAGTYVLPQGVRFDADNTIWTFSQGSLIKLWNTQATNDFIVFSVPVNQRVKGLRFDANRANQNATLFGIDNCGCIIVDAKNFTIEQTHIVSSPAKGLAVVSSAGGTNENVRITGVTGGDCVMQAVLIDGNNMTGFFKKGICDSVMIGETSHGGLVINDGVYDWQVSNVNCDVNNNTWDAVAIRDSWDLQLTNVKGHRGRNGVQLSSLNTITKNITMTNIGGDNNNSSSVVLLAVEDITGSNIGGNNNVFASVNIAQTGGGVRCKNITMTGLRGADTRGGSAVQQYGLHVGGCDNGSFGDGTYFGNVTRDVRINRAVSTNIRSAVVQRFSITTGSVAAGSVATVTITWTQAFEDTEYDVDLTMEQGSASLGLEIHHLSGRTATQITVVVRNLAAGALTGTVHAVARRRP